MSRKYVTTVLLITLSLLLLVGCGGGFDPYKELGVSNKDVPQYNLTSEVESSKDEQKIVFALAEENNFSEEQAKKAMAHYFNQHKENQDVIIMHVQTSDAKYTGEYNRTEKAYQASPTMEKAKKPENFPTIFFTKKEK